jgi:hypothetical protein
MEVLLMSINEKSAADKLAEIEEAWEEIKDSHEYQLNDKSIEFLIEMSKKALEDSK